MINGFKNIYLMLNMYSYLTGLICKLFKWLSTVVNFTSPMSIANPRAQFDNTSSIRERFIEKKKKN